MDKTKPYDSKKEAIQMAKEVSDFVNNFSVDNKAFCEQMAKEHRTLQQSFTRLCCAWFQTLAEAKYFDARNEESVLLAKKIVETCEIRLSMI